MSSPHQGFFVNQQVVDGEKYDVYDTERLGLLVMVNNTKSRIILKDKIRLIAMEADLRMVSPNFYQGTFDKFGTRPVAWEVFFAPFGRIIINARNAE